MADRRFHRVLFTTHLVKKRKTYHDGFLEEHPNGCATLFDDCGKLLAIGRVPSKQSPLAPDAEGLDCFERYLVNMDMPCLENDLSRVRGAATEQARARARDPDPPQTEQAIESATVTAPAEAVHCRRAFRAPLRRQPAAVYTARPGRPPLPVKDTATSTSIDGRHLSGQPRLVAVAPNGLGMDGKAGATTRRPDAEGPHVFGCGLASDCEHEAENRSSGANSQQCPSEQRSPLSLANRVHPLPIAATRPEFGRGLSTQQEIFQAPSWQPSVQALSRARSRWDDGTVATNLDPSIPLEGGTEISREENKEACGPILRPFMDPTAAVKRNSKQAGATTSPAAKHLSLAALQSAGSVVPSSSGNAKPSELTFPGPPVILPAFRLCTIPNHCESERAYIDCCTAAIVEDLNLKLVELASRFYQALETEQLAGRRPDEAMIAKCAHKNGVPYYGSSHLNCYPSRGNQARSQSFFVTLASGCRIDRQFRIDDLRILSNHASFNNQKNSVRDRLRAPWTLIARSMWRAPNKEGRFQIYPLSPLPPAFAPSQACSAIHGPEAAIELAMLDAIRQLEPSSLRLLPALACRRLEPTPRCKSTAAGGIVNASAHAMCTQFKLNEDQSTALSSTAHWFEDGPNISEQICIVHGPFGSGKSTLLLAMLHFFASQIRGCSAAAAAPRILVTAHTNIAVDRLLLGLLDSGFTDFLRVGSVRRIHKRLLPHSLHVRQDRSGPDAIAELTELLRCTTSKAGADAIRQEIGELKAGAERKRRRQLRSAAIVGTTCCSTVSPQMDSLAFDICVLDEAGQITEPLSLMVLSRSKARCLVIAGDPCQLPPLVSHPADATQIPGEPEHFSISRPMFARLVAMGYPSHLLRIQYRCHPVLSAVPNVLFYGGALLDGCTAAERLPLASNVPPLVCLNAVGQCQFDLRSQSCYNRTEATAVARVVERLLQANVSGNSIGIICLYRAQVDIIESSLAAIAVRQADSSKAHRDVQVATVDSFQGMEKEVVVLSPAVTRPGAFSSDAQRLNVALTRSRRHLILVGDLGALPEVAPTFAALLETAAKVPGSICPNLAAFIPEKLPEAADAEYE